MRLLAMRLHLNRQIRCWLNVAIRRARTHSATFMKGSCIGWNWSTRTEDLVRKANGFGSVTNAQSQMTLRVEGSKLVAVT
jgi:hypothetical protein